MVTRQSADEEGTFTRLDCHDPRTQVICPTQKQLSHASHHHHIAVVFAPPVTLGYRPEGDGA